MTLFFARFTPACPRTGAFVILSIPLLLLLAGCSGGSEVSRGTGLYSASWIPEDRLPEFDLRHLKLDLTIDHASATITGYAEHRIVLDAVSGDSITLDAGPRIRIDSVRSDGRALGYRHGDRLLRIERPTPDAEHVIRIWFRTENPDRGFFFTYREEGEIEGVDGFWTQGEPTDHHRWFPLADRPSDLATTETVIRTRADWSVVSNGRFLGDREIPGTDLREWHYRMDRPHAPYLILIAGAEYLVTTDSIPGIRLEYWTWPDLPERVTPTFERTGDMFRYFDSLFAYPYPWEGVYRQVLADEYIYGGMENTTATILADDLLVDEAMRIDVDPDGTIAHEIAHQWFGDLVTVRKWSDLWIHESFATYLAARYLGSRFGEDRFAHLMNGYAGSAAWVDRERGNDPIAGGENHPTNIYGRGAVVLHMLNQVIGDDAFTRGMRTFLADHAHSVVTSEDVERAFERASGEELDWFFDQWIHGADMPVATITKERKSDSVRYRIAQDPRYGNRPEIFRVPMTVEVYYQTTPGNEAMTRKVERLVLDEKSVTTAWYPRREANEFIVLAPNASALIELDYEASVEELWDQMHVSPWAVDRLNAAGLLAVRLLPLVRTADANTLSSIATGATIRYGEETDASVRAAILAIAGITGTAVGRDLIQQGSVDPDAEVREAAVVLARFLPRESLRSAFGHLLNDPSRRVIAQTLRIFRDAGERLSDREHERISSIVGPRSSVARQWLRTVASEGRSEMVGRVVAYAAGGSRSIRIEALETLATLTVVNDDVRQVLLRSSVDEDRDIVRTAWQTVRKLDDNRLRRELERQREALPESERKRIDQARKG